MRSQLLMGKRARFPAGLGLPRPADRAAGREGARQGRQGSGRRRVPRPLPDARAEIRRRDAGRVQASRLSRQLGRSLPDAVPDYEAAIARQLAGFVRSGLIYRDKKPVHWCLDPPHGAGRGRGRVRGPRIALDLCPVPDLRRRGQGRPRLREKRAAFVIWTTTPWTLPANLAVVATRSWSMSPSPGRRVPDCRRRPGGGFLGATGIVAPPETWIRLSREGVRALEGRPTRRRSPRRARPGPRPPALLRPPRHAGGRHRPGPHRPGHGAEDYVVGRDHGLRVYAPVDERGPFTAEAGPWEG